jgi:hypothetical protein
LSGEATICLMYFVVWAAIKESFFVHTFCCFAKQLYWSLPCKDNFQFVAAKNIKMKGIVGNWTLWYENEPEKNVTC